MRNILERLVLFAVACCLAIIIPSCTAPIVKMPGDRPLIVKTYKHMTVFREKNGLSDTGIHLQKGELFTVLVDSFWRSNRYLAMRVGDQAVPVSHYLRAPASGELSVGCYFKRESHFGLDVIVWKEEDWRQIAAFFREMKTRDPENAEIDTALSNAEFMLEIQRAEARTHLAIQEAREELRRVKDQTPAQETTSPHIIPSGITPPEPTRKTTTSEDQAAAGTADAEKRERIAALEAKLVKLQDMLAEFDQIRQALTVEQKKSERLTQKMGEMARREGDLLTRIQEMSKSPPRVVIASPEDGITVEVNIIGLKCVVEDDREIARIEIFVNGRPIHRDADRGIQVAGDTPGRRLSFQEQIPLQEGENRIRLRAVNTDGLATEKIVTLHHDRRRKNIWAVVIGINEYTNIRRLQFAVDDARAFYRHLVDRMGIPEENITLLLDDEADLSRLRSVLGTQLKNRAGEDDMVILYFAGHGATEQDTMSPDGDGLEKYLLPHGADMKDLYASALPMREIQHIFNRIRSQRLVFVVDSCYSGASGGRTIRMAGLRANISNAFMERLASGKGRVILSASGANEVSQESEELGHGVFTYYLLQGLQGPADTDGDGLITVDEAYSYVSRRVPDATGQEQNPVKKGSVEGRLVIGVRP